MNLTFSIDVFKTIDEIKADIHKLDKYDPITAIIKDKFELNITNYTATLKADRRYDVKEKLGQSLTAKGANIETAEEVQRDIYLDIGRKYSCTLFMFDKVKQDIELSDINLFYEILFGIPHFRDHDVVLKNLENEEKKFADPKSIMKDLTDLIKWYSDKKNKEEINPLIRTAYFLHRFLEIHPFTDGNGRIARLLMNITLMKEGYLPIIIKPSDSFNYYSSLMKADKGDLIPLTQFIAEKQLATLQEFVLSPEYLSIVAKYELEEQLKKIKGSQKCFILSEDKNCEEHFKIVLESSGFNLTETALHSYEGCSNITSVTLFTMFSNEKLPHIKIVVHRDRDYLTDEEIEKQKEKFAVLKVNFFVTKGTDIESHFVNAQHINFCHGEISVAEAERIISDSIDEVKDFSLDKFRTKEFGQSHKNKPTHLANALNEMYARNKFRFTHGKSLLGILKRNIQQRIKSNPNIERPSQFLRDPELERIAKSIWV